VGGPEKSAFKRARARVRKNRAQKISPNFSHRKSGGIGGTGGIHMFANILGTPPRWYSGGTRFSLRARARV
jgi:hypothetical protein